jgi:hypothetical protein
MAEAGASAHEVVFAELAQLHDAAQRLPLGEVDFEARAVPVSEFVAGLTHLQGLQVRREGLIDEPASLNQAARGLSERLSMLLRGTGNGDVAELLGHATDVHSSTADMAAHAARAATSITMVTIAIKFALMEANKADADLTTAQRAAEAAAAARIPLVQKLGVYITQEA